VNAEFIEFMLVKLNNSIDSASGIIAMLICSVSIGFGWVGFPMSVFGGMVVTIILCVRLVTSTEYEHN